eukprot:scaffold248934_cov36-Tisochrysis_lutea.AAC.1
MGHDGYSAPCRTGNWAEDEYMHALQTREIMKKQSNGTLTSSMLFSSVGMSSLPTDLAPPHPDGNLRYGDTVLLSSALGGAVSANSKRQVDGTAQKVFQVSRTREVEALRRTSWTIVPVGDTPADGLLRFDTPFSLVAESAGEEALYLHGERYTITNQAASASVHGAERKHLAAGALAPSHLTTWVVRSLAPHYEARMLEEKQPVPANTFVALEHVNTKSHLNTDEVRLRNEYGLEYSVSVFTEVPVTKGRLFGRAASVVGVGNHFAFTTGAVSDERSGQPVCSEPDANELK